MKQIRLSIFLLSLLLTLLLASCVAPMMGHGGGTGRQMGMMDRHHATVPEEYRGMENPVAVDDASLARGAELYTAYCATCHGNGGMGDGPAGKDLDPAVSPIAHTSQMLGDDYLFWRISKGGAEFDSAMPAWEGPLDEQARWDVINYMRALGSGDVMPRPMMGGATFDPEQELAHRQEMLDTAVEQEAITAEEAATFMFVHGAMDALMADANAPVQHGNMDERQAAMLSSLVESGEITQEQRASFEDVHERLLEAGLMQ